MNPKHALGLAAAVSLAVPAVAGAHGSVFPVTARVDTDPAPDVSTLVDQQQYAVTNHGFTFVLRESNAATTGGMVNYKRVPSGYRNESDIDAATRWSRINEGDTDAQPHATCDAPQLTTQAAIEAWQAPATAGSPVDPFYLYVPFQTTPAGLEDDPATWLAVLANLGITPDEIDTPAEAEAVCEGAPLGGTYFPADATQTADTALASGTIEREVEKTVAPLQAEIALLNGKAAELNGQLNAALAAKKLADDAAVAARAASAGKDARPLGLTLPGRSFTGGSIVAMVTGATNGSARVAVTVSSADQRKLRLKGRTVVAATKPLGSSGAQLFALTAATSTRDALRKATKATAVTITATSAGRTTTAKATLR